jgi:YebC/PmpR family DNA-binding regulatory protein
MSGHSKWANIKHRKGRQDALRGKIFSKLSRDITLLARHQPDPAMNPALADAMDRARAANMPKENIDRAIKRATGELPGMQFEEAVYEGYGPGGIAVLLRAVTDNKNRAASDIRRIFEEYGGNLEGKVAWIFERRGVLTLKKAALGGKDPDEIALAALDLGALDAEDKGDELEIYCDPADLAKVRAALERQSVPIESAESRMIPKTTVPLEGKEAERVLKFLDKLDELEDVQEVYANFEIPDEVLERVGQASG